MDLITLKNKYFSGKLTKATYIQKMHTLHRHLFNYARFIKPTDIAEIQITTNSIIMTTKDNKIKLLIDIYDKRIIPIEILNFNNYEKEYLDMMLKLIRPKATIFDIGANIGWYTINFAKILKGGHVYSFEPIPTSFSYLRKNLALNNITNARIFNYGLYNEEKILTFYYYPEGLGNASSKCLNSTYSSKRMNCRVRKMDDFTREAKITVDFIKCDVEGAELFVFQGGTNTIKRDKPVIFTELLRKWSAKYNYRPNDIITLLNGMGYLCFTISHSKLKQFFAMDDKTTDTNFFFLHSGKHSKAIKRLVA